jgi:hypothetical protein
MGALEDVQIFVQALHDVQASARLEHVWGQLPINEHCYFAEGTTKNKEGAASFYQVLGSRYQSSLPLAAFKTIILEKWGKYGMRTLAAKNNNGIDWKAISHAFRASYQIKDIFLKGDIAFPFSEDRRKFLLSVKKGELDFTTEVQPELEKLIQEVETLSSSSTLPEKCDTSFWESFVLDIYRKEITHR